MSLNFHTSALMGMLHSLFLFNSTAFAQKPDHWETVILPGQAQALTTLAGRRVQVELDMDLEAIGISQHHHMKLPGIDHIKLILQDITQRKTGCEIW